jgi:hypothetical protein
MSQPKLSPDETITAKALENVDPFARNGRSAPLLNQNRAKQQRDFSKYDEPAPAKTTAAPKEETKRGRKPKKEKPLDEIQKPTAVDVEPLIVDSRSTEGMPSYRCEFGGRDIFVGFLSYKFTNPVTTMALTALALDFGRDKIRFDLECGNSMIPQARNNLAAKFLETDAKYLFMLDDDIIPCIGRPSWMQAWVPAARQINERALQRHVLSRLVNANKSIIGAAYFERRESESPKIVCSEQKLTPRAKAYEDAIEEVQWIGTGAMLVHRKVFEDIAKNEAGLNGAFFHPLNGLAGEDVSFCARAKAAGHPIYIDLGIPTFHVGNKTY